MKNIPESMETARLAVSNLEDCCWQISATIQQAFGIHHEPHDFAIDGGQSLPGAMHALACSLDAIAVVCEKAANRMGRTGLALPSLPRPEPVVPAPAEKKPLSVVLDPPGEDGMVSARFDEESGEWVPDFVDGGHACTDGEDDSTDNDEQDRDWRDRDHTQDYEPGTLHENDSFPPASVPEPATPEPAEGKTGARPRSRRSGSKKSKKKSR